MYNKTIIGFGLRIISRIIQTSVNVIRLSLRLRQITLTSVWIILDIMLSPIQQLFTIPGTLTSRLAFKNAAINRTMKIKFIFNHPNQIVPHYTFCCSLPENILSLTPTSNSLTQKYIHFIQSTLTSVDTQPLASKVIL